MTPAERKRRQRQRGALRCVVEDWEDFIHLTSLTRKAGCTPRQLGRVVLKELVDNALDERVDSVTLDPDGTCGWIVADDGPGLDPAEVPHIFSVVRPRVSSKIKRMPSRGMLGNGLRVVMGAVAATKGTITVETRGRRLTLAVDPLTGVTVVTSDTEVPLAPGTKVTINVGDLAGTGEDAALANNAILFAGHGEEYDGPSSPWWYAEGDFHGVLAKMPDNATVGAVCADLGLDRSDTRIARDLTAEDAATVLSELRAAYPQMPADKLGYIGETLSPLACYHGKARTRTSARSSAAIPYVVEAWAECTQAERGYSGVVDIDLILNRSSALARFHAESTAGGITIRESCDITRHIKGPGKANYQVFLSVITPYVLLSSDGKEPSLEPFGNTIAEVLEKVCGAAYRKMSRPKREVTLKDAAWAVMPTAYAKASGDGRYPATARQIMYAARPFILHATGKDELGDAYFTQVLLPDYMEQNPEQTRDWDVVFDARGHFTEPHTRRELPLGTISVREYLGDREPIGSAVRLADGELYPTSGPPNRYNTVVFVEKEGFDALLQAAGIAERFDVAIMSTKGMSTTAARMLLDRLTPNISKVLVLHDFDVSGFSICGTLTTDGRRYKFDNTVPIVDIGLRLDDVRSMGLQAEPVPLKEQTEWSHRARTLRSHGANQEEIDFLRRHRVELNAMTAPVFIEFLERKLRQHGVNKVIPPEGVVEQHARRLIERELAKRALLDLQVEHATAAAEMQLPSDIVAQVRHLTVRDPAMPWDAAVAAIVRRSLAA